MYSAREKKLKNIMATLIAILLIGALIAGHTTCTQEESMGALDVFKKKKKMDQTAIWFPEYLSRQT